MSLRFSLPAALAALVFVGCAPERVETPGDLEGLAAYLFRNTLTASDDELDEAAGNLAVVITDLTSGGEPKVGSLPNLTTDDLAPVNMADRDPDLAPGFFLVNQVTCDFGTLGEVVTSPEQPAIHPGIYDEYDRQFIGDRDAWIAGDEPVLDWETAYAATPTSAQYVADTMNAIRRVPQGETAPGAAYVLRTVLKEPADFPTVDDDSHEFSQDYQLDFFVDGGDGVMLHMLGIWRYMKLGIVSVHDDVFIDLQLDGMIKWDQQTEDTCATWPEIPAP